MPANSENSAVTTGPEKVRFHSNLKEGQCQRCSNYCTIALISEAIKVMLKILQARIQHYMNQELPDVQGGFRDGTETRDQNGSIHWIIERAKEFQKNIYFCFIDYAKAFVWMTINWKILKKMEIPYHLTCFMRNLYAGQESIVRTRHEMMDWLQIGKGVCQSCTLSPCLFNLYAVYIIQNAASLLFHVWF